MSVVDPADCSALQLLELYRKKKLSPVEATEAVLARARRLEPDVNAFVLIDEERALGDARAAEARWQKGERAGLVDGVPASVKDLMLAKGWPMRGGSRITSPKPVEEDAPLTARMREHGTVLIGKTTTPEFGWKGVTDSPLTGITRNPWDTSKTPGGSSGGAAVAAALGMGALHAGSDGGGSIRIPAGFTGIFGHKPSFGRVPRYPNSSYGTLSHAGPMTRTVSDAALMLTVISEPDARDWFALPYDDRDYLDGLEDGIAGVRIAASLDLGYAEVDPEVAARFEEAIEVFAKLGAMIERIHPAFDDPTPIFRVHWCAGAANMARSLTKDQEALLDPGLLEVIEAGRRLNLLDYMAAVDARADLGRRMKAFHENCDLLLTPSLPIAAFDAGLELPASHADRWTSWTPFTYPFNLTQQPAASLPCGFTKARLPIGLQIVGPPHGDFLVLRAARAFERERPFEMPKAPRVTHTASR